jgi:type 1 glutamine amidotransferase
MLTDLRAYLSFIVPFVLVSTCLGESAIRVLIVDGFGNHDWRATTADIERILGSEGAIECEVSTVPIDDLEAWSAWQPRFSDYDVVVQNTTDIRVGGAWPEPAQDALVSYVRNGGGLYVFHSANNAFPEWLEYNRMIGLGWRKKEFGPAIEIVDDQAVLIPAGQGGNTGHGERMNTLVTSMNEHPIHAGLPRQWMAAELETYRYARGPAENLTVISYAQDLKTQMNFPIEWVVEYGAGRVYSSSYGHHWHTQSERPAGIRCVAFQTIFIRSLYWLAKLPVPDSVPPDFPSTTDISLVP